MGKQIFLSKLEKFLFFLLIFSLPFQKRAIIYSWGAEFNEWNSSYLYFTDIVIGCIFILWFLRCREVRFPVGKSDFMLLFFLIIIGFSLFKAANLILGVYQWLKLIEFSSLFFYVKYNLQYFLGFKKLLQLFIASGIFQSIIAIIQFFNQKNLGLYAFEESIIGPQLPGVAKIDLLASPASPAGGSGFQMLRAYGTFPHANPLALFLSVSLICLVIFYSLQKEKKFLSQLIFIFCSWFLVLALFLTFSRAIIILTVLGVLFCFVLARNKSLFSLLLINMVILSLLLYPEFSQRFNPVKLIDSQAVNFRLFYNQIAFSAIKSNAFLGVGLGNFVGRMAEFPWNVDLIKGAIIKDGYGPWIYQPAHNVFLLIGTEVGLIGLLAFLWFLLSVIKGFLRRNGLNAVSIFCLLSFLSLFFVDHYLWTLQQGSLLLWVGLGILTVLSPYSSTDRA